MFSIMKKNIRWQRVGDYLSVLLGILYHFQIVYYEILYAHTHSESVLYYYTVPDWYTRGQEVICCLGIALVWISMLSWRNKVIRRFLIIIPAIGIVLLFAFLNF